MNIFIWVIIIGIIGLIVNKRNFLMIILSLELIFLGFQIMFLYISFLCDDIRGLFLFIIILCIAACETSIGLALLICLYRLQGDISVYSYSVIRG